MNVGKVEKFNVYFHDFLKSYVNNLLKTTNTEVAFYFMNIHKTQTDTNNFFSELRNEFKKHICSKRNIQNIYPKYTEKRIKLKQIFFIFSYLAVN